MLDPDRIVDACGVLVGRGADGQFAHLATCWSLGGGDWVTGWDAPQPPVEPRLLRAIDGVALPIAAWECADGIAGFTAEPASVSLAAASDATLRKRDRLRAIGFPSMVDHPAFRLSHHSLDPERYVPYLCPWTVEGPLVLFSSRDGWLPGRMYAGMAGGPVLAADGSVVGILADGAGDGDQPPLARFRRID